MPGCFGISWRKKKDERFKPIETGSVTTDLERICGNDKETYNALLETMFLDPRKIKTSLKETLKKATDLEKKKDNRARMWYDIAGGLAIYEGNVKKVVEYFGRSQKLSPDKEYTILKTPEKAVEMAQKYYKEHLKEETK